MRTTARHAVIQRVIDQLDRLTPKGRILGDYVVENPLKAVFMTTKELAETCGVSEATVVRFVSHLGYDGYGEFLQALRDFVDSDMSLSDRIALPGPQTAGQDRLHRVLLEEVNNLHQMYETIDREALDRFVDYLASPNAIYVAGSRLSFTFAYYLGWSLTKVRQGITILKGSDSTCIDWLVNAPAQSTVAILATSRYPNELIKLGKLVRRLDHTLLVIADSNLCPLIHFAHESLVAPSKSIPLIGYPTAISCIINYLVLESASRMGRTMQDHQGKLEQIYRESDLLFNLYSDADLQRY
jgi:DNA-binding MurR/RpiR family transcriptional regulator